MRIAVITDVHANLPALEAALKAIHGKGYDAIFHTGDAIAIGPYPAECLELLLNTPNIQFVKGNHESYFVDGLPDPRPPGWMSEGEPRHQHWTHAQLDSHMRSVVTQWPYLIEHEFGSIKTAFLHSALGASGREFQGIVKNATASDLDQLFASYSAALIFYGHRHENSDVQGRSRYVNPGSVGCCDQAVARYCMVDFYDGQYTIEQCSVPYEDTELFRAFEQRNVPDRLFIYRTFFGGRFHN
jgi:putative phosphoesterase